MSARVLVVDDSEVNLLVAETKLSESGFSVETAKSGEEALKLLLPEDGRPDCPYDAVLLDIMMPGIDGMEVLTEIRKVFSPIRVPVVMATAKDQTEDVVAALSLGANDYITKPLDLPVLVARLNTHIDSKRVHEELKKAQKSLVSAARIESVGFLAAGVAHEIRNPLGRIQMSVGGLKTLINRLPEDVQDMGNMIIETVEESVGAADRIVQTLMSATREDLLPLEEVDLNQFLKVELHRWEPELSKQSIDAIFNFGEVTKSVLLAEESFRMVFDAVMKNAVQAMSGSPENARRIVLRTGESVFSGVEPKTGGRSGNRLRTGDAVATISIEDSGPGMSPDALESAFDAFFSTQVTGTGTGMGLTVARKIMDLHNGLISIENRVGEGSGLIVSLLLKQTGGLRTNV